MSLFDSHPPRVESGAVKCDVVTDKALRPCDLPPDHELFDPFDFDPIGADKAVQGFSPKPRDESSIAEMSAALGAGAIAAEKAPDGRRWAGFESEAAQKAAQKLPKGETHHARAIAALSKMFPGYRWRRTEFYVSVGGVLLKRDFQGFGDILGQRRRTTKEGPPFVAGQITTSTQIMPHLRKYTSDAVSGGDEIPIEEYLRDFLALGNELIILGYYREMVPMADGKRLKISNWMAKVVRVTPQMLDETHARKRKK